MQRFCRSGGNNDTKTVHPPCKHCKKTNHHESRCFFRNKQGNSSKNEEAKVVFFSSACDTSNGNFIVDSGATTHMTNDRYALTNVKPKTVSYTVANNERIISKVTGDLDSSECLLKNVAYVPDLSCNLLSVNKVTEANGTVTFTKDKVVISKDNAVILEGSKSPSGLYVVDVNRTENVNLITAHRKLAHLGVKNLKRLKAMSEGLKIKEDLAEGKFSCDVCNKAKHVRTPFSGELPKATRELQIIHTDVCGPIEPTHDNKRYFVTFLDDFTHFAEVYLINNKSEVAETVKEYVLKVENAKNKRVSKIKCDNGKEYLPCQNWCKSKGIEMDFTAPYSCQMNGCAERLNRTLADKMRAMLFDSGMKNEMWGEALRTACYVTNRCPTAARDVTPYELWHGKRPDLSKLQLFGCYAYCKKLTYLKKLDERSRKLKFVGYAPNGYRLWNDDRRKVEISRDVIFSEVTEKVKDKNCKNDKIVRLDLFCNDDEIVEEEPEAQADQESNIDRAENIVDRGLDNASDEGNSADEMNDLLASLRPRDQIHHPAMLDDFFTDLSNLTQELETSSYNAMLTYDEALSSQEKMHWLKAIEDEKNSLEENKTWCYVDENDAKGRKILTSRWVFKLKDNGVYKARLVVRGYQQVPGVDYDEFSSPVVNMCSLRVLLTIAAAKKLNVQTFDVKTAFLTGDLDRDVFMYVPEGFEKKPGKILKLRKSLYGLVQSPLMFNIKLKTELEKLGLKALKSDPCVFKGDDVYLAVYVDDGLAVGSPEAVKMLMENLKNVFKITVDPHPTRYLGMDLKLSGEGIHLSQKHYCEETLSKYHMSECKPAETPLYKVDESKKYDGKFPYRAVVGSLLYLSTKTRPDVSFAVGYASRNLEQPTEADVTNVKRTMRYLQGTKDFGLLYKTGGNLNELIVYCDSDYAGDNDTRRSTTGYVCYLNGAPISWCSRRQPLVAQSSTEAEFIAAAEATKEVLFLKSLVEELCGNRLRVLLNIDNSSAIHLIKNGKFSARNKHIDVRYRLIVENYLKKCFDVQHCPTESQTADILTKPLLKVKFDKFREAMLFRP